MQKLGHKQDPIILYDIKLIYCITVVCNEYNHTLVLEKKSQKTVLL